MPSSEDHLPAVLPAARLKKAIGRVLPAAILVITLCAIFLRAVEFQADGRGMDSVESAYSHSPIDDDSSPDPILAGPGDPSAHSGKYQKPFFSFTVRPSSPAIAPPAPPPKV